MKVLHVTNRIYPEFNGGTEIHVYKLCGEMAKNNDNTVIFTQQVGQTLESVSEKLDQSSKIKKYIYYIPNLSTKKKLIYSFFYKEIGLIKFFLTIIAKEKPDVIHFHHLIDLSPWLVIICWFKNIPNLLDLVDYWFICPNITLTCNGSLNTCATVCNWQNPSTIPEVLILRSGRSWLKKTYGYLKVSLRRFYWRNLLNHSNTILVPISERTKDIYIKNGYQKTKMVVKPCGIKVKKITSVKTPRHFRRIGYIGSITPGKGIGVLVSAFKKIGLKDIRLNLYGQNRYKKHILERMIGQDKRIYMPTPFDHKDLYQILSKIDILIVPSILEETFCLVVQEALSANIPIIASSIGGMKERIIEGVNGFLVEPNNLNNLKNKMEYVINNYRSIVSQLKYNIGQYSLKMEVAQLINLYDGMVNKKPLYSVIFSKEKMKWVTAE